MSVRVLKVQGIGAADMPIVSKLYASAIRSGCIFIQSVSDADYAAISINSANFMLLKDIVANNDTLTLHRLLGTDAGEIKVDTQAPFLKLVPGMKITLTNYSSSGTDTIGNVDSSTAVRTALGVERGGKLCVKQSSGEGSTQIALLVANDIATDSSITVEIVSVTG